MGTKFKASEDCPSKENLPTLGNGKRLCCAAASNPAVQPLTFCGECSPLLGKPIDTRLPCVSAEGLESPTLLRLKCAPDLLWAVKEKIEQERNKIETKGRAEEVPYANA